jgi:protein-L-isoaspartate O-methyltransferase
VIDDEFENRYASSMLDELDFEDKRVLEVGFGNGWLINDKWQQVRAMTAVEDSLELVEKATDRWADTPVAEKVTFVHGDMGVLLLPEHAYDLVVFSHSY